MNPDTHIQLPPKNEFKAKYGLCDTVVEAIFENIEIANECGKRIREEGIVVRDLNGAVIEHPAIKTQQAAIKLYTELLKKHATKQGGGGKFSGGF